VLGRGWDVDVLVADHQNKTDIAVATARRWFDQDGVDALVDVSTSATALAVNGLARERNKVLPKRPASIWAASSSAAWPCAQRDGRAVTVSSGASASRRPPPLRPGLPWRGPRRAGLSARFGFLPCEGGRLTLSGVFDGRLSLASNSATRAVSACVLSAWMSASFSGGAVPRQCGAGLPARSGMSRHRSRLTMPSGSSNGPGPPLNRIGAAIRLCCPDCRCTVGAPRFGFCAAATANARCTLRRRPLAPRCSAWRPGQRPGRAAAASCRA
jgi:hypothetical protein